MKSSIKPIKKTGKEKKATKVRAEGLELSAIPKKSAKKTLIPKAIRIQKPPDRGIDPECCFLSPSGISTKPNLLKIKGPIAKTRRQINTINR